MVNAQRAGRTVGKKASLFGAPRRLAHMRPRHQFGGAKFDRRILWKVKHLNIVQLGAKDAVGIVVSTLSWLRTLRAVMAGQYRQLHGAP